MLNLDAVPEKPAEIDGEADDAKEHNHE